MTTLSDRRDYRIRPGVSPTGKGAHQKMSPKAQSPPAGLAERARSAARYGGRITWFIWSHPANEGARLRALSRAARHQLSARVARRRTLARLGHQSRIWVDLHRHSAFKVAYANPPDYPEMLVWQRAMGAGSLFIDVGANIGSYSVLVGELGAEVIALEPADDTFRLLKDNIALNGYNIRPVQAAAGSDCGAAKFTSGRDCVNQLDPAGDKLTTVVTIDSLIGGRAVDGMKVDVEGFELDVLRGSELALAEHRIAIIQLEWNATSEAALGTDRQPVADLLARHGYRLFRPDRSGTLMPLSDTSFGADVFACPDAS
jgi:FkbM family methyltransferase